jgi:hypothetical protein
MLKFAHSHAEDAHSHAEDAHSHAEDAHSHAEDAHSHAKDAHSHAEDAHSHAEDAHSHAKDAHSHAEDARTVTQPSYFNTETFNSLLYGNVLFYCCHGGNLEVRELNFIIVLRPSYALINIAHWFKRN